jgi:protein involved in polysaccharide export with SLBB domain
VYEVQGGELLRDMVVRAGGVTPDAYIYGTQLTRESARVEQQKGLDALALSVESEVRQATALAAARSTSGDDVQSLGARESSQKALIAELKNSKASGRVVLALMPSAGSIDDYPAIALEDNDQVVIPHRPATVSVVGMVYNAGSFVFRPRCKVADYLKLAGKGRPNADIHHAFVLHADGSVTSSTAVNGAFAGDKFSLLRVHPGDQIVVPSKIQTGSFIRGLRDWTQITSQLALTGAALAVIR